MTTTDIPALIGQLIPHYKTYFEKKRAYLVKKADKIQTIEQPPEVESPTTDNSEAERYAPNEGEETPTKPEESEPSEEN